ncbi:MAG: diadenylate cyclase CdaA [Mariprofundaceae bacterium]|nr:diadenylate cyclase CdaA [Mariprofundaceae bacterium]
MLTEELIAEWHLSWLDLIDVLLVAAVIYAVLRLIRGTRAVQVLTGLTLTLLLYEVARVFGLFTLEWVFSHFFSVFIVIIVVLFQQELRRGLMKVALSPLTFSSMDQTQIADELVKSALALVHRGWGGLIVIERDTGLRHLYESALRMKSPLQSDLVQTLFCPQTPLHDGAIVVHKNSIVAARVLLPLTQGNHIAGNLGTRHRAAVGVSEESDAIVLIVSEECQDIRLAYAGHLTEAIDQAQLRTLLIEHLA